MQTGLDMVLYFIIYKCIFLKKINLLFELILKHFITDFSHKCGRSHKFQGDKNMHHRDINGLKSPYHQLEKFYKKDSSCLEPEELLQ